MSINISSENIAGPISPSRKEGKKPPAKTETCLQKCIEYSLLFFLSHTTSYEYNYLDLLLGDALTKSSYSRGYALVLILTGTQMSDTVCEPCPNGTFSNRDSALTCMPWTEYVYSFFLNLYSISLAHYYMFHVCIFSL